MQKAHFEKVKEMDSMAWKWCGDYVMAAAFFAVEHNLHGKKAKFEYPKNPILHENQTEKNTKEGRATIERMNFELRSKILKDMGFPMPPH